jgi:hypothetical protein
MVKTNTQREKPADRQASGQEATVTAVTTGEDLLAALSPEHLKACREAAKIAPLLNLQLALLLAKRAKAQAEQ